MPGLMPDQEGQPQQPPPHSELASFGEELRREREIRGISLKEIADATKISKRFLEAIERNDHRTLPAPVFTRGFVREYAKYLGLNTDEIVNRYNYAARRDEQRARQRRHAAPRDRGHGSFGDRSRGRWQDVVRRRDAQRRPQVILREGALSLPHDRQRRRHHPDAQRRHPPAARRRRRRRARQAARPRSPGPRARRAAPEPMTNATSDATPSAVPIELTASAIIERIESGAYPREILQTIAAGFLPLPQDDLVAVLAFLAVGSDSDIAGAARTSLEEMPSRVVVGFAENDAVP